MKKIVIIIILTPLVIFSQYFGERTTEQSFEQSELYFNSHYMNTFGLLNFKAVSVGLVNDPFLNLYLNPAILPEIKNGDILVYLDFRGDRTETPVLNGYVAPNFYADMIYRPYVDPRWFTTTRTEPEPTVSLGLLTYPLKEINDRLFIGGTYQFIHREEKFYTVPYLIYTSRYYYDALNVRAEGLKDVPIKDRLSGKDEMVNQGHLFSAFAGYQISMDLSIGISLNGIIHKRDGGYFNSNSDEFGNTDKYDWSNSQGQERDQKYHHFDFSGGIQYKLTSTFGIGVKAGILSGDADQDYYYPE